MNQQQQYAVTKRLAIPYQSRANDSLNRALQQPTKLCPTNFVSQSTRDRYIAQLVSGAPNSNKLPDKPSSVL